MSIKESTNASLAHTRSWTRGLCEPSSTCSKTLAGVSLKTYPRNKPIPHPYSYPRQQDQCLSFGSW